MMIVFGVTKMHQTLLGELMTLPQALKSDGKGDTPPY